MGVAVTGHCRERRRGKPRGRQEQIDKQTEAYGRDHYRADIYQCGTPAHGAREYHHRGKIGSRPGHEQHKGHSGTQPLEHERQGDGYRAGGTYIHRHRHEYHHSHCQERITAKAYKELVWHEHCDKRGDYEPYHEPFAHARHHVDKTVAHGLDEFAAKAHVAIFVIGGHTARVTRHGIGLSVGA